MADVRPATTWRVMAEVARFTASWWSTASAWLGSTFVDPQAFDEPIRIVHADAETNHDDESDPGGGENGERAARRLAELCECTGFSNAFGPSVALVADRAGGTARRGRGVADRHGEVERGLGARGRPRELELLVEAAADVGEQPAYPVSARGFQRLAAGLTRERGQAGAVERGAGEGDRVDHGVGGDGGVAGVGGGGLRRRVGAVGEHDDVGLHLLFVREQTSGETHGVPQRGAAGCGELADRGRRRRRRRRRDARRAARRRTRRRRSSRRARVRRRRSAAAALAASMRPDSRIEPDVSMTSTTPTGVCVSESGRTLTPLTISPLLRTVKSREARRVLAGVLHGDA